MCNLVHKKENKRGRVSSVQPEQLVPFGSVEVCVGSIKAISLSRTLLCRFGVFACGHLGFKTN
jgi:hypothetical protein